MSPAAQAEALGLNSRYLAYCYSQGRDPVAQRVHDGVAWPGGINTGYLLWVRPRIQEWKRLRGMADDGHMDHEDHAAFDAWLDGQFPAPVVVLG